MMPSAPWRRSLRACSRSDVWSSHLECAFCSLGLVGLVTFRLRNSATAQGFNGVPALALLHLRPLSAYDRAAVADELAGQAAVNRRREKLSGFELLDHRERLGLATAARLVVAREREEDDEPGENRESAREH